MRLGKNPLKEEMDSFQCEKIGIAILNYIPFEMGYFSHAFDILKIQLESIRQTIKIPVNIFIFDNGSNFLIQKKLSQLLFKNEIDFLFLSNHNLGKTGALNWIFASMPNDYIVYSDSDVLFRMGWLEASMEILTQVPNTGLVSAQPCLYDVLDGNYETKPTLDNGFDITYKQISSDVISEYINGLGGVRSPISTFTDKEYPIIESKDKKISCIIGASHMQFLTKQEIIKKILPLPARKALSKNEDFQINKKIDELSYLQLSTSDAFVYHMGNTIDDTVVKEMEKWGNPTKHKVDFFSTIEGKHTRTKKIIKSIFLTLNKNSLFSRMFDFLYKIIFEIKVNEKKIE